MLFTFRVTAPPETAKTEPVKKPLKLRKGIITKISVLIPPGHAALAHLAIFDGETQIMPWGDDQWIEGADETITWEPDYELPSEPAILEARAWNESTKYSHTFYIRIWIKPTKVTPRWELIERGAQAITRLTKRILGE